MKRKTKSQGCAGCLVVILSFFVLCFCMLGVLFSGLATHKTTNETVITPATTSINQDDAKTSNVTNAPVGDQRTWVNPYTRKDGTPVKGHWRK